LNTGGFFGHFRPKLSTKTRDAVRHSDNKKTIEMSVMSQLRFDESYTHTIYLSKEQYLPDSNIKTDLPWSIALNVLASFRLSDFVESNVALFLEYQDLRGKHRLPVDFHKLEFEAAVLFSNLVQIPIRGELEDVCLKLVGIPESIEVETEWLHTQVELSRSFVNNQTLIRKQLNA
jgi:hypothetical protein